MDAVIAAVVVGGIVAAIVPLVIWAVRASNEAAQRREAAWRSFASSRGWKYVEAGGPWHKRKSASIQGELDGVAVTVDSYVVHSGKSHVAYTRVQAAFPTAPSGKLAVYRNGWWPRLSKRFGARFSATGDREFDERFAVRANPEALVSMLLGERARRRIAVLAVAFTLAYRDGHVSLTWVGVESDEARLEAACSAVASVCVSRQAPYAGVRA